MLQLVSKEEYGETTGERFSVQVMEFGASGSSMQAVLYRKDSVTVL